MVKKKNGFGLGIRSTIYVTFHLPDCASFQRMQRACFLFSSRHAFDEGMMTDH